MSQPDLLTALRDFLIEEGIVRDVDAAGPLPPFWREPRNGPPAPGEGSGRNKHPDATVSALTAPGVPVPRHEQIYHRIDGVDLRFRTRTAPIARELDRDIRAVLADRRGWTMGGLQLIESIEFRPFQSLGSDDQGFDFVTGYLFESYVNPPA